MSNLSIAPMRAYYDTRMSHEDIILLGIVCSHTDEDGNCFPGLERLSLIFSPIVGRAKPYDISSMSKKMARLESFGYLLNPRQRHVKGGGFSSNQYRVILDGILPLEFDRRKIQTPLENASVENQTPLENASTEIQTNDPVINDPIERPSNIGAQSAQPHQDEKPVTPKKKKERKPKPPKEPKPKTEIHPAVSVYRSVRNVFPRKELWAMIADTVGSDETNLEKWRGVLIAWAARGYNPINVSGALAWFSDGVPEQKSNVIPFKAQQVDRTIQEVLQRGNSTGNSGDIRSIFSDALREQANGGAGRNPTARLVASTGRR